MTETTSTTPAPRPDPVAETLVRAYGHALKGETPKARAQAAALRKLILMNYGEKQDD